MTASQTPADRNAAPADGTHAPVGPHGTPYAAPGANGSPQGSPQGGPHGTHGPNGPGSANGSGGPDGSGGSGGGLPGPWRDRPPRKPRHRILALLVVVLLIAIPAAYLVISALQSRDSGEDKQRAAAATSLEYGWPSRVQRRIYDVPIPPRSSRVAFYEENSWERSTMYVQFRTSSQRLEDFLRDLGSGTSGLREGRVTISGEQATEVGWDLPDEGHSYAGTTLEQPGTQPELAVTVDTTHETRPQVYVVSTTEF